jgi:hypothetical protein
MQLSNSALGIYEECNRCFWLEKKHNLPRPRGIFSSLPNGIDKLLKSGFDAQRGTLPAIFQAPELEGFVLLDDAKALKALRHWKSNPLKYTDQGGNVLVGAFDDMLFNPTTETYAMLDFKTRGSEPDLAYCKQYYQRQVDTYTLFIECSGNLKAADFGVLQYFYPIEGSETAIKFATKTFILKADPARTIELFDRAIKCLNSDIEPPASDDCVYCNFSTNRTMRLQTAI